MRRGAILLSPLGLGLRRQAQEPLPVTAQPSPGAATSSTTGDTRPAADGPLVVFLGDSLAAGFGLAEEEAFPAVVAKRLARLGTPIRVVNAGVSGDTSAGGLRRLGWLLRQRPAVLVVELGANDGLRGQPLVSIEENLRQIVQQASRAGCRVLLVGMRVPPSLGEAYSDGFAGIYPQLAEELGVPLMPFLLDGVAGNPTLNLPDGIHPTAAGHQRIADALLPHLQPLITDAPG